MADESNAVATRGSLPSAFRSFLQKMEGEADIAETEPGNSTMVQSFLAIIGSETEDEMWASDDLAQIGGRDLVDVEQEIRDFSVKRSNNPGIESPFVDSKGNKMYLLVTAVKLATGEEFVWNTSAPLLVGKLFWLAEHEMFPYACVIKGTDLGGSQTVLKLKKIPPRAVRAEAK